ncbi:radical SAM protein [Streptomyces roseiscleroticus]|uniref:B12-binding domain-containing radical SAM protein n=1 Tax=Streptomyces roseiscleroticus TaxID=1972 RepID=UPI0031F8AB91
MGMRPHSVVEAINTFQDPVAFYDYRRYRKAVLTIKCWFNAMSAVGLPAMFDGVELANHGPVNLSSLKDLVNPSLLQQLLHPFDHYLNGPLSQSLAANWDLIGISVNYISQLPFTIRIAELARSLSPNALLCLGGTEITDVIKFLRIKARVWEMFPGVDLIVVGEGESAFIDILSTLDKGVDIPNSPGIISRQGKEGVPPLRYENMATLAVPRYDVWDWSQYWSPEPVALYSPTRGCYWNKCTFCDYGLNTDRPTSPSRERPISLLCEDLRGIAEVAHVAYLAVDAMSPRFLKSFAEVLIENNIFINWSAELRLDRTLARGLAEKLHRAGAVALSFGYESGSQRVLNLIDKGVRIEVIPSVLSALSEAKIGAQMMGFVGFPGETEEEACSTYLFLLRNSDNWTLAGIGDFTLTPGAIVARNPESFGITRIGEYDGDDIVRALFWADEFGHRNTPGDARSSAIDAIAAKLPRTAMDDRPWVGGIDSNHSILYFSRNGPSLVPAGISSGRHADIAQYQTPFSHVESFSTEANLYELHRKCRKDGWAIGNSQLREWLDVVDHVGRAKDGVELEILPDGSFITAIDERGFSESYHSAKVLLLESYGLI